MRKKSAKRAAQRFKGKATVLDAHCDAVDAAADLSDQDKTYAYDGALIKLAAALEVLMLEALICAVNNDTAEISKKLNVAFPKHLSDEVCEYIVTGGSYFDYKGRDGLIKQLKAFLPDDHYLVTAVKRPQYQDPLERLVALRNFAAHESIQSKRAARRALGVSNISAAGAWAKRQNRFKQISARLRDLADEIEAGAPY